MATEALAARQVEVHQVEEVAIGGVPTRHVTTTTSLGELSAIAAKRPDLMMRMVKVMAAQ